MPRSYRYHVYDRAAFAGAPPWSSRTVSVPRLSGHGTDSKQVYSLKRDMAQLRSDGAAKGIVDSSVRDIGTSPGSRKLHALKVGRNPTHKVLFTGAHHAREWISVEIPYLVAEYLIQNYNPAASTPKELRIKHLVDNREIWFVPMVNPDGHEYTTTRNRDWRTNRKAHRLPSATVSAPRFGGGPPRSFTYPARTYVGVDINRNYATATWGQETFDAGTPTTSRDPRDCGTGAGIWCGPAGESERETKAVSDLYRTERFKASISYHSYSELLLYPDAADRDSFVQGVGHGMSDLIAEHGNPYTYQSSSTLYATTGDFNDFAYAISPGRPTFTPELRPEHPAPSGWAFSGLPESEIEPCFKENLAAALALINCAGHTTVPGCSVSVVARFPFVTCSAVANCWNVFKGWVP